jgi:pimeloyl-ACP methyl ester carboxylesterase
VNYFSGFSLEGEETLFECYLKKSEYCIAGFSYGAQQAFEYVYQGTKRVDRLILLSPAFFQTQKPSFIRTQLRYFEANKEAYIKQFLQNVSYPSTIDLSNYLSVGSKNELEALLTYKWDLKKLQEVQNRGTVVEVFLGEKDKIIESREALHFFTGTTTYFIKDAGHLLRNYHD